MKNANCVTANKKFTDTLSELMTELGYDYNNYTKNEIDSMIYQCCREFDSIWDEFVLWTLYGDDKKAKTRALIRTGVRKNFSSYFDILCAA